MNDDKSNQEAAAVPSSPFMPIEVTDGSGKSQTTARRAAFSLQSLFIFFTICAVFAQFIALLVLAAKEDASPPPFVVEANESVVIAICMLLPFAAIAGALLYARKTGIVLSVILALVAGPVVGISLFLPTKLAFTRNIIAFGVALLLIGYGVFFVRPPSFDQEP